MPDNHNQPGQPAQAAQDARNVYTLIRSITPAHIGKSYDLNAAGEVIKRQAANMSRGEATSYDAVTVDEMADTLADITTRADTIICPALWHGDGGADFTVVTEAALAGMLGPPVGSPALAGVHIIAGERYAARLRRGLQPSSWVLFDADNPPGIPAEWAAMGIAERLAWWEPLLPGVSTCERIELYGSSARVIAPGVDPETVGRTHAWLRVDDPAKLAIMKAHLGVAMVVSGLSFPSPRYSRTTGEVMGHARRSVFDLSVFDPGRLVFFAVPEISQAMANAGYTVRDAGVRVVNDGGGTLSISGIEMPSADMLAEYARVTGERLHIANEGGGLSIRSSGVLTLETEIESRGVVRSFGQWLEGMADGATLRCEAPFRASVSEAAFIRRTGPRAGYIHDVGNATTYTLEIPAVGPAAAELGAAIRAVRAAEEIAAAVQASEEANADDAQALERIAAVQQSVEELLTDDSFYVAPDPATLPRRPWIMKPDYLRGHVSALVAPGGAGKSSLILVEALALVSGKPLLPPRFAAGCYKVCVMNAEDGSDETHLRIAAAMKLHGITQADIAGGLMVRQPGDLTLVRGSNGGRATEMPGIVDRLIQFLKRNAIDVLILDPLASFSEGEENSNTDMAVLIRAARRIATQAGVALVIVHHTRKTGGNAAGVEDARGASALIAGVRSARVINTMTTEQAAELGVDLTRRRSFFSITNGKLNYAEPGADQWCEIVPVVLPNGEQAHTIRPYIVRAVAMPYDVVRQIHGYLTEHGPQRARGDDWFGWTVARLAGVEGADARTTAAKKRAAKWIARLIELGVVVEASALNAARRPAPGYGAGALPGASAWQAVL